LIPKFASEGAARSCELRNRDTRALPWTSRMIRSVPNWAHPRKRPSLRLSVTGFMYLIAIEEV
jgi:hypothetical protein